MSEDLKFTRIFGEGATSKQAFSDSEYNKGWGFLGQEPPPYELFDDYFNLNDKKHKYLYEKLNTYDGELERHNTSMDAHSELLSQYIRKDGDTATGKIYVPTPETSDNSRVIANTAFVNNLVDEVVKRILGDAPSNMRTMEALATALANDPTFATTMRAELEKRAPLNSPTFSGSVRVPTAGGGENSTIAASTQWVRSMIDNSGFIPRGSTRSSYNETGYRVFSDGFCIQWGKIGATREQWVSFPIQFSVKNVTATMIGMATGSQSLPYVKNVGNTGFTTGSFDFGSNMQGIYWRAVGKI